MNDKTKSIDNVDVKIELWKEINNYANNIEGKYSFFVSIVVAIFSALMVLIENESYLVNLFELKVFLLIFLTLGISIIMAYLAYNFRAVAIARMYATALEKSINKDLNETIFTWNSDIVNEFFAKNNFTNKKLLPSIYILLFGVMGSHMGYFMWCFDIHTTFKIIYVVFLAVLFILCVLPFAANDKIRKHEYKFGKNH